MQPDLSFFLCWQMRHPHLSKGASNRPKTLCLINMHIFRKCASPLLLPTHAEGQKRRNCHGHHMVHLQFPERGLNCSHRRKPAWAGSCCSAPCYFPPRSCTAWLPAPDRLEMVLPSVKNARQPGFMESTERPWTSPFISEQTEAKIGKHTND